MIRIEFGERDDCDFPTCRAWRLTVGGKVLTGRCSADGYYGTSEVDIEFISWLVELPRLQHGEAVTIPFSDDPHEFRLEKIGDRCRVSIAWKSREYVPDGSGKSQSVWSEEVDEGETTFRELVTELLRVGREILEMSKTEEYRGAYAASSREAVIRNALLEVTRIAQSLGIGGRPDKRLRESA